MQVYVVWNVRIYSKCASVCCAIWIALSVEGVYCRTELFWKQLLNEVKVKIILISSSRWWCFHTATSAIDHWLLKPSDSSCNTYLLWAYAELQAVTSWDLLLRYSINICNRKCKVCCHSKFQVNARYDYSSWSHKYIAIDDGLHLTWPDPTQNHIP